MIFTLAGWEHRSFMATDHIFSPAAYIQKILPHVLYHVNNITPAQSKLNGDMRRNVNASIVIERDIRTARVRNE